MDEDADGQISVDEVIRYLITLKPEDRPLCLRHLTIVLKGRGGYGPEVPSGVSAEAHWSVRVRVRVRLES